MTSVTAYIDEAGNLTDARDRFVIVTALIASPNTNLSFIVPKAKRKLKHTKLKRHHGREVKWANSSEALQRRVLGLLVQQEVAIFWLAVDKENQSVEDTPENYGVLVAELLRDCLIYYPTLNIRLDRHFSQPAREAKLSEFLTQTLGLREPPRHLDSQKDGQIQLADFVAGALLQRFTRKGVLADMVEKRIIAGKIIKWRSLQQKRNDRNTGGAFDSET